MVIALKLMCTFLLFGTANFPKEDFSNREKASVLESVFERPDILLSLPKVLLRGNEKITIVAPQLSNRTLVRINGHRFYTVSKLTPKLKKSRLYWLVEKLALKGKIVEISSFLDVSNIDFEGQAVKFEGRWLCAYGEVSQR